MTPEIIAAPPRKKHRNLSVYLPLDLIARIDAAAKAANRSRANVVLQVLERFFAAAEKRAAR